MSDFPGKENSQQENPLSESVAEIKEETSTVFSDPAEHKKTAVKQKKRLLPIIIAAVLAVAVLAGGTFAVIKLIPEREEDSNPSVEAVKLIDESPNDFKSVTVTNENGTFKLYSVEETVEGDTSSGSETEIKWYLDGYDKELINTSLASYTVDYASSVEVIKEITAKTAAECGLENPVAKVDIVKNDGTEFSLLIGGDSPDNTGTYVKLSTSDKIYIAESEIKENFVFDAVSFASNDKVEGIAITDDIRNYADDNGLLVTFDAITLSGKNLSEEVIITPNTDDTFGEYAAYMTVAPTKRIADNVSDIFSVFKNGVSVTGAYSFDTSASALKKFGLDDPDLTAKIKVGSLTKTYIFKLQEDGDYAVWYDGSKLIKKVLAANLSFVDYKVTDYYASWVCLQELSDLSNFTVKTTDKTYSFDIAYDDSDEAEESFVITYEGKNVVVKDFKSFYEECVKLACTDFTVDKLNTAPEVSLIFTYADTSYEKTTVDFRKASETKYQYNIDGVDMGKLNSSSINKILKMAEKVANGESVS